jgi:hypothetical protein
MDDVVVVCDNDNYKILYVKIRYEYKTGTYIRQVILDKRRDCMLTTTLEWSEADFADLFHKINSLDG